MQEYLFDENGFLEGRIESWIEAHLKAHHDIYVTVYDLLSRTVHTSISDLNSYVKYDTTTKKIEGIDYGPSSDETARTICLGGRWLAEALENVASLFGEDIKSKCDSHRKAFDALLRENTSKE